MTKRGIDVSKWQGEINFVNVKKSGVEFVIIRCNDWSEYKNCVVKDPYFEKNYKNAKAAGLDVGVYYYTWETSSYGAEQDSARCIEYIKGKKFEYPIYFDLEWNKAFVKGKTVCSNMVSAFCKALEKAGYFAGLYISRDPLQNYISQDVARSYTLWIAEYGSKCNYNGDYAMWQYSSSGRISGISGNVDMDYCYKDFPTIIKNGGYNGYEKPKTPTVVKVLDSNGYKRGDKSVGVYAYKQLLKLACKKMGISATIADDGGFGGGTEKATNAVLKKLGYKQNGIAGKKLIKKLSNKIK